MARWSAGLAVLALAWSHPAHATPEFPEQGECSGTYIEWIDNSYPDNVDCSAEWGAASTCGLVDCVGPGCAGYGCVAQTGASCGVDGRALPCNVERGDGCNLGTCLPSVACDPATFQPACDSDHLSTCRGTVNLQDCTQGGTVRATCATRSDGRAACVGLEGAGCLTAQACQPGLECRDNTCQTPGSVPPPCPTVGPLGECNGDAVKRCVAGREVTLDCAASYGPGATCGLLDCTDSAAGCAGNFCVARASTSCDILGCDVAQQQGCLGGTCQPSMACDPLVFPSVCNGSVLTWCSRIVEDVDCSRGGTVPFICGAAANGDHACLGLRDAPCNAAEGLGCAAGLVCTRQTCQPPGTVDAGATDAAVEPADAGDTLDAALALPDAAVELPDAAVVVTPDAGDAPDAAVELPDASIELPDAATGMRDASPGMPDAAMNLPDAAIVTPDAAVASSDASVATDASSSPDGAASTTPPDNNGSCGCSDARPDAPGAGLVMALVLLGMLRIRRARTALVAGMLVLGGATSQPAHAARPTVVTQTAKKMNDAQFYGYRFAFGSTPAELLSGMTPMNPKIVVRDTHRFFRSPGSATTAATNVPDGTPVGTEGVGPCLGVLIVAENGNIIVGHYKPDGEDPLESLQAIYGTQCMPRPKAYLFTLYVNDEDTGRTMQRALKFLECYGIPVAGYAVSDSLYAYNDGTLIRRPSLEADPTTDKGKKVEAEIARAVATKKASGLAGSYSSFMLCPSRPANLDALCTVHGSATASCPAPVNTPVQPFAKGTVGLWGNGCGFYEAATLDDQGLLNTGWPPGVNQCSTLEMDLEAAGDYFETTPVNLSMPLPMSIDLGQLQVRAAKTAVVGVVKDGMGAPVPLANVRWGDRELYTTPTGQFSFLEDWGACEVQATADSPRTAMVRMSGQSKKVPAVPHGTTDVGTIVLCPISEKACNGSCIPRTQCCTLPDGTRECPPNPCGASACRNDSWKTEYDANLGMCLFRQFSSTPALTDPQMADERGKVSVVGNALRVDLTVYNKAPPATPYDVGIGPTVYMPAQIINGDKLVIRYDGVTYTHVQTNTSGQSVFCKAEAGGGIWLEGGGRYTVNTTRANPPYMVGNVPGQPFTRLGPVPVVGSFTTSGFSKFTTADVTSVSGFGCVAPDARGYTSVEDHVLTWDSGEDSRCMPFAFGGSGASGSITMELYDAQGNAVDWAERFGTITHP